MTKKTPWSLVLLCAAAAFLLAMVMSHAVFHRAPITSDETSYLFQAQAFLDGTVAREAPNLTIPFISRNSMLILDEEAGWLSRYPPGHALWLLLGLLIGSPSIITALACALGVGLLVRMAPALSVRGWVLAWVTLSSPYFLFMYGTLLSHTSGFLAVAILLTGYLRWQQEGRTKWAAIAGMAWGWVFLNRTYTALLIAIPFGLDALIALARKRTRQELLGTLAFAGCAALGVIALLVYNKQATGHPLTMTYLLYNPSDNLGFGLRHHQNVYPASLGYEHTPARGMAYLGSNLLLLDQWLWGFHGGLVVLGFLTLVGWSRRWTPLLIAVPTAVAIGYVAFWFPGWNETGPIYYFETMPMILFLAARGLDRILTLVKRRIPLPAAGLAGLMVAGFWFIPWQAFMREKALYIREITAPRRALLNLYDAAPDHSLLFLPDDISSELWHSHDFLYNPRGLDSRVLTVRWLDHCAHAIMHEFADRSPFLIERSGSGFTLTPLDPADRIDLEVDFSTAHRLTGKNMPHPTDTNRAIRVATSEDRPGWLLAAGYDYLYPGRFVMEYDIDVTAPPGVEIAIVDVSGNGGRIDLGTRVLTAETPAHPLRIEFEIKDYLRVEPRVYFNGGGDIRIEAIRLRELPPE